MSDQLGCPSWKGVVRRAESSLGSLTHHCGQAERTHSPWEPEVGAGHRRGRPMLLRGLTQTLGQDGLRLWNLVMAPWECYRPGFSAPFINRN